MSKNIVEGTKENSERTVSLSEVKGTHLCYLSGENLKQTPALSEVISSLASATFVQERERVLEDNNRGELRSLARSKKKGADYAERISKDL